jgi:hypothetical protein
MLLDVLDYRILYGKVTTLKETGDPDLLSIPNTVGSMEFLTNIYHHSSKSQAPGAYVSKFLHIQ